MGTIINNKDWRFVPVDPEPGFNPDRNKRIIERTIKKTDAMRKLKMKLFKDQLAYRSEAVASFLTSRKGAQYAGATEDRILRYFGKRELARLRGEEILETLMSRPRTIPGMNFKPRIVDDDGKVRGYQVSDVRQKDKKRARESP